MRRLTPEAKLDLLPRRLHRERARVIVGSIAGVDDLRYLLEQSPPKLEAALGRLRLAGAVILYDHHGQLPERAAMVGVTVRDVREDRCGFASF